MGPPAGRHWAAHGGKHPIGRPPRAAIGQHRATNFRASPLIKIKTLLKYKYFIGNLCKCYANSFTPSTWKFQTINSFHLKNVQMVSQQPPGDSKPSIMASQQPPGDFKTINFSHESLQIA